MARDRTLNQTLTTNVTDPDLHDALGAIDLLKVTQSRLSEGAPLWIHLEWAKEAIWAAAYPGGHDDSLLNALEVTADQGN